jgi:hypothetical protein
VQRLQIDFELGIMELDANGIRIEHEQPLKSFLTSLPHSAPYELPSLCAGVVSGECESIPADGTESSEILPPPTAPQSSPSPGGSPETPAPEYELQFPSARSTDYRRSSNGRRHEPGFRASFERFVQRSRASGR